MNILHISRTMGQGGAEKVVYQLCKGIDENMTIASTGGVLLDKLEMNNIKHYTIPDIDNKNPLKMIKTFFILKKIVKNEKIDVIHSHHRMAAFYSKLICLFTKRIKRVYTAHNVFYNKKILLKFALSGSKIIAVGDGVKNNLINYFGINKNNIDVIYNSVEKPPLIKSLDKELKKSSSDIFIGNVGRLSEQKGIDVFIKSLSDIILKNKNVKAFIVGDGELKNELTHLVTKLGLNDNIIFLGYRSDVLDIIKTMDFIVLSSRWEGFPLTPIESFMMGKTVIASNIDGNNEIVKNNYNGLLFEKNNVKELKNKIEYIINNIEKRHEYEENAISDYSNKYSYEKFLKEHKKLYSKLGD